MVSKALQKSLADKEWRKNHLSEYRMTKIKKGTARRTGHLRKTRKGSLSSRGKKSSKQR